MQFRLKKKEKKGKTSSPLARGAVSHLSEAQLQGKREKGLLPCGKVSRGVIPCPGVFILFRKGEGGLLGPKALASGVTKMMAVENRKRGRGRGGKGEKALSGGKQRKRYR